MVHVLSSSIDWERGRQSKYSGISAQTVWAGPWANRGLPCYDLQGLSLSYGKESGKERTRSEYRTDENGS